MKGSLQGAEQAGSFAAQHSQLRHSPVTLQRNLGQGRSPSLPRAALPRSEERGWINPFWEGV